MNRRNYYNYIRFFVGIIAFDAFTAIPFAGLRKEYKPGIFSLMKTLTVIITLRLIIIIVKITQVIYGRSNGCFRSVCNPDYKERYIFIDNLISSFTTILILLPILLINL
jgi:hypothetical protein